MVARRDQGILRDRSPKARQHLLKKQTASQSGTCSRRRSERTARRYRSRSRKEAYRRSDRRHMFTHRIGGPNIESAARIKSRRCRQDDQGHGDRVFMPGPVSVRMSRAEPFTKMPISWRRTYGGTDMETSKPDWDQRNPVGTGFAVDPHRLVGKTGPNFEYPDEPYRDHTSGKPAGFGPVARHWQPRVSYAGTYGEEWKQTRDPLLPRDFSRTYYQCAPEDQQTKSPLIGYEDVRLRNFTPTASGSFCCRASPSTSLRSSTIGPIARTASRSSTRSGSSPICGNSRSPGCRRLPFPTTRSVSGSRTSKYGRVPPYRRRRSPRASGWGRAVMAAGDTIVIVGVGARTPLGFDAASSAAAVRAGLSGIQDHPFMVDRFGERMKVTRDIGIDVALFGPDRSVELAISPALEALRPLLASAANPRISAHTVNGRAPAGTARGLRGARRRRLAEAAEPACQCWRAAARRRADMPADCWRSTMPASC